MIVESRVKFGKHPSEFENPKVDDLFIVTLDGDEDSEVLSKYLWKGSYWLLLDPRFYKGKDGKDADEPEEIDLSNYVSYSENQEKEEAEKEIARKNIDAMKKGSAFMIEESNNKNDNLFNGNFNDLVPGNYVLPLGKQFSGIPEAVRNHIGEPLILISYGGANDNQLRVIIGLNSFTYISGKNDQWVFNEVNFVEDVFILENSQVIDGNMTVESSRQIDQKKRFDLYCNGVLINPNSITIDNRQITASKDLSRYEFEVNDIIVLKYNHK